LYSSGPEKSKGKIRERAEGTTGRESPGEVGGTHDKEQLEKALKRRGVR